jgi:hypothetical protein
MQGLIPFDSRDIFEDEKSVIFWNFFLIQYSFPGCAKSAFCVLEKTNPQNRIAFQLSFERGVSDHSADWLCFDQNQQTRFR